MAYAVKAGVRYYRHGEAEPIAWDTLMTIPDSVPLGEDGEPSMSHKQYREKALGQVAGTFTGDWIYLHNPDAESVEIVRREDIVSVDLQVIKDDD